MGPESETSTNLKTYAAEKLTELAPQFVNILLHAVHISFWLLVEYFIEHNVIGALKPADQFSQYSLNHFRVLFTAATVTPPTLYLVFDLLTIGQRLHLRFKLNNHQSKVLLAKAANNE